MNKYEFRKWNTYEEWYEIEAKDEKEAWDKLRELGEEDITTSKFVGQEGETELYRTTQISDEDEEEEKRMEDEAKAQNRENYEEDEARETVGNAVQDSGFLGQMD